MKTLEQTGLKNKVKGKMNTKDKWRYVESREKSGLLQCVIDGKGNIVCRSGDACLSSRRNARNLKLIAEIPNFLSLLSRVEALFKDGGDRQEKLVSLCVQSMGLRQAVKEIEGGKTEEHVKEKPLNADFDEKTKR